MAWISNADLVLFNLVFEDDNNVPKNKKHSYKLRHISFYSSNTKAITNICKNMEKYSMHVPMQHHYIEVLRKMGLVNNVGEITTFGHMFLDIIHYNNNYIIECVNAANSVDDLPEEIIYEIEFFLFATVSRCLNDPKTREVNSINRTDLAYETIENLDYFFANVIDTLKEPTNKNFDFTQNFDLSNEDFYYTIQAINFSGFEIKRLLRMTPSDSKQVLDAYRAVLSTQSSTNISTLSPDELRYYRYAEYYNKQVQKDVRKRVKFAIFNYILLNSIKIQHNKIKLVENTYYSKIIPFTTIKEKFEKYNLKDIFNLVFFERDSKFLTKVIKPFKIDQTTENSIKLSSTFTVNESDLRTQHINLGDSVIFTDLSLSSICFDSVYDIVNIIQTGTTCSISVNKKQVINTNEIATILDYFS